MKFLTDPKERTRFLRFLAVGGIGFVVDFGVFNLMISVFGVEPVIANIISFSAAVVSNFTWNRLWTYPDSRTKTLQRQLAEFTLISVIGIAIRTPIFWLLETPLEGVFGHFPIAIPFEPTFLAHNGALAVAVLVVLFWNFFANRYWTYADVK
ncbi:MAG TPA: GtrA family protein [Anaerolineales bacterium]|nr:GtrA family protein [Anaerolineales bacterium]